MPLPPDVAAQADRVAEAYDRIAGAWAADRARSFRERALVERLAAPLAQGAAILDVGCGAGVPIAAHLAAQGLAVTGLDASARMLAAARAAVPSARFVHGDLRTADPGGPFDAAVAWDCLFHLPRDEHAAVFRRLRGWLRPGGRLLVALGGTASAGFTATMHGETFFYSAHAPAAAMRRLVAAGFEIEHAEVDDPTSRGHLAVLAVATPRPGPPGNFGRRGPFERG